MTWGKGDDLIIRDPDLDLISPLPLFSFKFRVSRDEFDNATNISSLSVVVAAPAKRSLARGWVFQ
jgi:hypothetical protein